MGEMPSVYSSYIPKISTVIVHSKQLDHMRFFFWSPPYRTDLRKFGSSEIKLVSFGDEQCLASTFDFLKNLRQCVNAMEYSSCSSI